MVVAGIDPGKGGGIAVINADGDCETVRMPTMRDGKQTFVDGAAVARFLSDYDASFAIIELVHSYSRQGVRGVFTFGCQYGGIVSVVRGLCIPHKLVTPQRWKKDLGLTSDKDLARARAAKQFPKAASEFARKCDDGRAEAALIAWWFLKSGYPAKQVA